MVHEANAPVAERITRTLERKRQISARSKRKRDEYRPMTRNELTRYLQENAR